MNPHDKFPAVIIIVKGFNRACICKDVAILSCIAVRDVHRGRVQIFVLKIQVEVVDVTGGVVAIHNLP